MNDTPEIVYMDAVLTPNQSLSRTGFLIVMGCISVISFFSGIAFYAMGALPVAGFFGLDVLVFYLALRWAVKSGRESTRVTITTHKVNLHHTKRNGDVIEATLPCAFTRISMTALPSSPTTRHLHIESGQKAYVIGRFLVEEERENLAEALQAAILSARAERYPTAQN